MKKRGLGYQRGLHSHAYQEKVYELLAAAGKKTPTGASKDDVAALLKEELRSMAAFLEDGKAFW